MYSRIWIWIYILVYECDADLYFFTGTTRRLGLKEEEGATVLGEGDPGIQRLFQTTFLIWSFLFIWKGDPGDKVYSIHF